MSLNQKSNKMAKRKGVIAIFVGCEAGTCMLFRIVVLRFFWEGTGSFNKNIREVDDFGQTVTIYTNLPRRWLMGLG